VERRWKEGGKKPERSLSGGSSSPGTLSLTFTEPSAKLINSLPSTAHAQDRVREVGGGGFRS
jgi:hypothetical protein